MSHKFYMNPKDGHMNLENPKEFRSVIKSLRQRRHVIEIKEWTDKRSNGANSYYWKIVIGYFMDEMGIPESESGRNYMHYDCLGRELRQVPDPYRPGQTMTQTTHDMDASTFWKYIYQCGLLFNHWFNGSFPPPKSLGYDTDKL